MKKYLFMLVLFVLFLSGCLEKVPAGYVGVKYYLLGGDKGISHEELSPGRYWIGINEELYLFPTFRQNKTWTNDVREDSQQREGFEFQSKEGLRLTANIGMEYQIEDNEVSDVFEMYKRGPHEITNKVLRNAVRSAFNIASSTRGTEQIYGKDKMDFLREVKTHVQIKAKEKHILVNDIYLIGNIGIPESVTRALNKKLEATQKAQQRENELRETEAEAKKQVAKARGAAEALILEAEGIATAQLARAKGESQANKIIALSISSSLIKYKTIMGWDGKLPQVTSGGIPLISIK